MTGGILQLAFKSPSDIFLTTNPEITFFKTVYRRYANFSKEEFDLRFGNKLDFGRTGSVEIEKLGDLLHRLFLVIVLPRIDTYYRKFRVDEVTEILKDYDINWTNPNHNIFSKTDFENVKKIIVDKISEYDDRQTLYRRCLNVLSTMDHSVSTAFIIDKLMELDPLCDEYKFVNCLIKESKGQSLINYNMIQKTIRRKLVDLQIGKNNYSYNVSSFAAENLYFINRISEVNQYDQYNEFIKENIYLDSQHCLRKIIKNNDFTVNIPSILKLNLSDNIRSLKNIYESINNNTIIFYKIGGECWSYLQVPNIKLDQATCTINTIIKKAIRCYNSSNINIIGNFLESVNFNQFYTNKFHEIPIILNNMIYKIVAKFTKNSLDQLDRLSLDKLNGLKNCIHEKISQKICNLSDNDIIELVGKSYCYNDIQICVLKDDYCINGLSIPEYILYKYQEFIKNSCKLSPKKIDKLLDIIDEEYKICSDWTRLVELYQENLDNMYNNYLLNMEIYKDKVGITTIYHLANTLDLLENKCTIHEILDYLESQIYILDRQIENYEYIGSLFCTKQLYQNNLLLEYARYDDILNDILCKICIEPGNKIVCDMVKNDGFKLGVIDLYNEIMDNQPSIFDEYINLENFRKNDTVIKTKYNGFREDVDLYVYMMDVVINHSFLKEVVRIMDIANNCPLDVFTDYFLDMLDELDKFMGPDGMDLSEILDVLEKSVMDRGEQERPKFSWIKYIGHYIINNIEFMIGDQIIDKSCGEWLHIWYTLTRKVSKERGYNVLIGNVPSLYTYNSDIKDEYELIVPLNLWFSKNIMSSLPLLALPNKEIRMSINLKNFDEVCRYNKYTGFRIRPRLKCKIIAEYIYVDEDERNRLYKNPMLEYVTETLQTFGDVILDKNNVTMDNVCGIPEYYANLNFTNLVKELVWVLQRIDFIDGSIDGIRQYDNYGLCLENEILFDQQSMLNVAQIEFNRIPREKYKPATYYNYVQPYQKKYASPSLGIYLYSFSLYPENEIQQSGYANFNKLNESGVRIILCENVYKMMIEKNIQLRFKVYGVTSNIYKITENAAGLLFI